MIHPTVRNHMHVKTLFAHIQVVLQIRTFMIGLNEKRNKTHGAFP